jgi:tRNA dimethylallyltransferase
MGVALARRFNGEVVSVDSMQLYRSMEVGTAAPTPEETEGIPHHMVGVAEPTENWSVAKYVAEADKCVQDILARGKLPVLVGGTGLYLDALIRGIDFAAGEQGSEKRQELQQRMENEGAEALLAELRGIDPQAAAKLHLKDEKRIIRALEV